MITTLRPIVDFAPADAGLVYDNLVAEAVGTMMTCSQYDDGHIQINYSVGDVAEVAEAIENAVDNV